MLARTSMILLLFSFFFCFIAIFCYDFVSIDRAQNNLKQKYGILTLWISKIHCFVQKKICIIYVIVVFLVMNTNNTCSQINRFDGYRSQNFGVKFFSTRRALCVCTCCFVKKAKVDAFDLSSSKTNNAIVYKNKNNNSLFKTKINFNFPCDVLTNRRKQNINNQFTHEMLPREHRTQHITVRPMHSNLILLIGF